MSTFQPSDPDYADRVRASFDRQRVMATIGAELVTLEPGLCTIELPFREDLTQQHGFLHAGIATTIADSAGGYAAFTLMPADSAILAVEFKVNLLSPAKGVRFRATGRVQRAGKRLSVCALEVVAIDEAGEEKAVLTGLQTSIQLPTTTGLEG